jgi:hypothetical protein
MATAALDAYYLYRKTTDTGRVALSSPTTPAIIGSDDEGSTGLISIGFTFNFDNTDYTSIDATSNGMIGLGVATTPDYLNALQGGVGDTRVLLCPWWDDLSLTGNKIRYELQGTSPNRSFVIDYECQAVYNDPTPNLKFQIILYETTNRIEFRYDEIANETAFSSACVGVKGDTSSIVSGNFRDFIGTSGVDESNANGGWNTVEAGIPNNSLNASYGNDYPGDSTNSTSLGQYYFLFSPDEEGAGGGGGGGGSFPNTQSLPQGNRYTVDFVDNQMSQLVTQYDRGANQENYVPFRLSVRGPSNLRLRPAGKVYKVTKT